MGSEKRYHPMLFVVGSALLLFCYFVAVINYVPSIPSEDPQLQSPIFDIRPMLLFVGVLLALMVASITVFLYHKPKTVVRHPYHHAHTYVRSRRKMGASDHHIKQELKSNGWHDEHLKEVFAQS